MVEMIVIWVIAPLVLATLSYGLGLIFAIATRKELKFYELIVLGFLAMVVLGSAVTSSAKWAHFAAPITGVLAILGITLCRIRFRHYLKFDRVGAAAGALTYSIFSFPLIMYGKPTWAGWVQLDDSASWYALANRLMSEGHSIPTAVLSTYDRVLQVYLGVSAFNYGDANSGQFAYPTGGLIPFGVLAKIVRIDMAWLFQPFLSFCAALIALLFVESLKNRTISKSLTILGATFATLASTIFSYVMWGGIKEVLLVIPIVFFAMKVFADNGIRLRVDTFLYLLITILSLYFIGAKTSLVFIIPIAFVAVLVAVSRKSSRYFQILLVVSSIVVAGLVYALASDSPLLRFLVPQIKDLGNLYGQLNPLQVFGIWPSPNFRIAPISMPITYSLISVATFFLGLAIYRAIKRGEWVIPSLILAVSAVVTFSYLYAGAWITGKAIAVASPIFLFAVVHGAWEEREKSEIGLVLNLPKKSSLLITKVLIAAVVIGVLGSDALTYRNVWIAPYSQTDELRVIGRDFAGQGPTLMADYSPIGSRYFLRNAGAESPGELRVHLIPMRDGTEVPKGATADIDLFPTSSLDYFNLLVLRKSARLSRPPLNFSLARSGENYEVWKRNKSKYVVQRTLPLGNNFDPASTPSCDAVSAFLADRAPNEKVFAVEREKTYLLSFTDALLPKGWTINSPVPGAVNIGADGGFSKNFTVDKTGEYRFWLGGSYPGRIEIAIDGVRVFKGQSVFEGNPYLTNQVGSATLTAGSHLFTIFYKSPWLVPGSGVKSPTGPIYISTQVPGEAPARAISNSQLSNLCQRNLDWIAIAR